MAFMMCLLLDFSGRLDQKSTFLPCWREVHIERCQEQPLGNFPGASKLPSDTPPNWRMGSYQPPARPGTLPDLALLATKVPGMLEKGQIGVLVGMGGGSMELGQELEKPWTSH